MLTRAVRRLPLSRAFSASPALPAEPPSPLSLKRAAAQKDISALPETLASSSLRQFLVDRSTAPPPPPAQPHPSPLPSEHVPCVLDCVLATFHLHVNSRVASLCGEGFYTIGPCGEESLAAIGPALQQRDSVALHYRHLAVSLHRNWLHRDASLSPGSLAGCLLDRARGYTVSSLDPVSGGNHCALGGAPNDFLVTSTLASQCPPAVGRALGSSLAHSLGLAEAAFEKRAVHFVTLGDGSTANGHFLSSLNLAAYAQHRSFKCPLVFGVSDNQISISLRNYGYLSSFLSHCPIKLFEADGSCIHDVHAATKAATDYSRRTSKPSLVHYKNISRRCPTRPLSLVLRPPPLT